MRQFIRHPTDIPIQYDHPDVSVNHDEPLNDIGEGGLSFRSCRYLEPGSDITVRIPVHHQAFEGKGTIVWSRKRPNEECWDIGVRFEDEASEYRLRMIEQVCYIEHYRKEALEKEGRDLSSAEAAAEWVKKYAGNFPR